MSKKAVVPGAVTIAAFYRDYREVPVEAWLDRWPDFWPAEIGGKTHAPCDRTLRVDHAALDALQALRTALGVPMVIFSGYRSPGYNARVGGARASQHLLGRAFDVSLAGHDRAALVAAARAHGFGGIGHYRTFLHLDTRAGAPAEWDRR
jgi:zinc D-Ala-D-Ala carboxypeptidase